MASSSKPTAMQRARRWTVCAVLIGLLLCAWSSVSPAQTSNVVVSANVVSATNLNVDDCVTGSAATNFGVVLPGNDYVTAAPCTVIFGSSNDTAMLRMYQLFDAGGAMAASRAGEIDQEFGNAGIGSSDLGADGWASSAATVLQPDGKILILGRVLIPGGRAMGLARFLPSGQLDATFGIAGIVVRDVTGDGGSYATSLVLQPDGKILVASGSTVGADLFVVNRFNPDGSVDSTFGTGGMATVHLTCGADPSSIVLQSTGKIVVIGSPSVCYSFGLARFTASGALDTTFGTNGIVETSVPGYADTFTAIGVRASDDSIYAGGDTCMSGTPCRFALMKFDPDGATDAAFGTGGSLALDPTGGGESGRLRTMMIQPDGKLLVAGTDVVDTNTSYVVRLALNGTLDTTFGVSGVVTDPGGGDVRALALTSSQDILVHSVTGITSRVTRYDTHGAVDYGYGSDGTATSTIQPPNYAWMPGTSITVDDHDNVVLVGKTTTAGGIGFGVQRLTAVPDPNLIVSDFASGTQGWSSSTSTFGVCLQQTIDGAQTVAGVTWDSTGSCAANDSDPWRSIPSTSVMPDIAVASTSATSIDTARADLYFGFHVADHQPPGTYSAPVVFDVIAPG